MIIAPGATSRSITVYAYDATTGLPYTTAAYNDAGIALWYRRGVTGAKTAITPASLSALTDAYSSGGFKVIAENAYRLDLPDAALASGVDMVALGARATGWDVLPIEVGLEAPQTGDSYARIGAAGVGLTAVGDTSGTTTLLSRLSSARAGYLDNLSAGAVALASDLATVAGYLDTEVAAIKAKTDALPSDPADQSAVEAAITAAQSAVSSAIAALNNLSQAQAQTAAAAALTAYDPPTHAELTAGLAAGDDAVLAAIAGLNNLSSAQVSALLAAADDATLAAIAALNDLSSAEVEALIAGGSGATPETFWNYDGPGGRTLTMAMIAILSSMIEGTSITITRGDTYSIPLVGLGNLAGRTGLWFTVKAHPGSTTDADAKIQVTEAVGLVRLNGASAQAGGASITVDDEAEGDITIHLAAATTAQLGAPASWRWDVQVAQPGPGVWTPRAGAFLVDADVTRATS